MDINTPSDDSLGEEGVGVPQPSLIQAKKRSTGPSGAFSRYLFTTSAVLGIILAAYAFLWLIGRSTQDTGPRLDLPQRSIEQIYRDAEAIPSKAQRLSALKNFAAAYPESDNTAQALISIEALIADEYQGWLTLSDIFYDARAKPASKLEALNAYTIEWGGGAYNSQLGVMREKLEDNPLPTLRLAPQSAPGLTGAQTEKDVRREEPAQSLAGAAPEIQIYKPAVTLPVALPEPQAVIIDAKISKDRKPKYPSRALARGITATVTVSMDINAEGRVKAARIVQAATGKYAREFGISALRAAKRTRFDPKTIDGVAAPTNGYTRKYTFEIEGD